MIVVTTKTPLPPWPSSPGSCRLKRVAWSAIEPTGRDGEQRDVARAFLN